MKRFITNEPLPFLLGRSNISEAAKMSSAVTRTVVALWGFIVCIFAYEYLIEVRDPHI